MVYIPYNMHEFRREGRMCSEFDVEYYVKSEGNIPVVEFLDSLNYKQVAKILREIQLLEMNGNYLRDPHSKALRNGIFELRTQYDGTCLRIFYFFAEKKKIILTHGFVKKIQKTPSKQINTAIEYRNEYLKRIK